MYSLCTFCLALVSSVYSTRRGRIGGGKEVNDPTQFPFFAVTAIPKFEGSALTDAWTCGASLIHPEWVLTAGHCVPDNISTPNWKLVLRLDMVFMGSIQHLDSSVYQGRRISEIYRHPGYEKRQVQTHGGLQDYVRNNIALVKLDKPFNISRTVQKIQLPTSLPKCKYGIAIGIGISNVTDEKSYPEIVKYATILRKEYEELKVHPFSPSNTTAFAEGIIGKEDEIEDSGYALYGDTGGPFICADIAPPVLIGVLSGEQIDIQAKVVVNIIERADLFIDFILQHIPNVFDQGYSTRGAMKNALNAGARNNSCLAIVFIVINLLCVI